MPVRDYTENELTDLEIKYRNNDEVLDLIYTLKSEINFRRVPSDIMKDAD